jgi:hypothetical protein
MALKSELRWLVCCGLLLGACSSADPPSEATGIAARKRATSSQTVIATMSVPSGMTTAGFLLGQTNIQLDSNIVVAGPVWSAGSLLMQPDVKVQAAIVTTGNVALTDRDALTSVIYGGTLTRGIGDSIGTSTHASLTNITRSTSVTFPAASLSYTLNSGQSFSPLPGSYVAVTANSGATLTLGAGEYYFGSLDLESSSVLSLKRCPEIG